MASKVEKLPVKPQAGTVHWLNECIERGKREVFSETVMMTPGLAAELLRRNPGNRILSEKKIARYTRDMLAERWAFNGEGLIVAATGELNNGQHRLSAVIEANRSVPFLIVFGVARETRTTVDQGLARTAAHYLTMDGIDNSKSCAAIAQIVIAMERSNGELTRIDLSHSEIVARVLADPDIRAAARFSATVSRFAKGILSPAQIGACLYLFAEVHPRDADEYMRQVCVGENIKRNDPAFTVRQALGEIKGDRRAARMEAAMRGWVAFRQGRPLKHIKFLQSFPALV